MISRDSRIFNLILILFSLFLFHNYLDAQVQNGAGPPVTRSQMILTADKYASVHWTMSDKNLTGKNSNTYLEVTIEQENVSEWVINGVDGIQLKIF